MLSSTPSSVTEPALAADGQGNLYLAWESEMNTVQVQQRVDGSWTDIYTSTVTARLPALTTDSSHNLYLAYAADNVLKVIVPS